LQKVLHKCESAGAAGEDVQLRRVLEKVPHAEPFGAQRKTRMKAMRTSNRDQSTGRDGTRSGCDRCEISGRKIITACSAAGRKDDLVAIDDAMKSLEPQLKKCAKDICQKYINPPKTTDLRSCFASEGRLRKRFEEVGWRNRCRAIFLPRGF